MGFKCPEHVEMMLIIGVEEGDDSAGVSHYQQGGLFLAQGEGCLLVHLQRYGMPYLNRNPGSRLRAERRRQCLLEYTWTYEFRQEYSFGYLQQLRCRAGDPIPEFPARSETDIQGAMNSVDPSSALTACWFFAALIGGEPVFAAICSFL